MRISFEKKKIKSFQQLVGNCGKFVQNFQPRNSHILYIYLKIKNLRKFHPVVDKLFTTRPGQNGEIKTAHLPILI
jgi:hypothetical protein